ncbi:MAG: glycosyltransferase family 4 protein [Anaerolineales bacterium]|nr:glycosyltransferase family 4 protein [Anaerolineales bacterium]
MRLGLIIYGSPDTVSGGYLYDRQLVAHLRAAGDEVEVISLPWRNYAAHLTQNFSIELRRRLAAARYDVLLQDELNHPSLFLLNRRLRPRVRYPFISIVHHLRSCERRPAWQNALYRCIEAAYLRSVDGFVFNSETTREAVSALTPHPQPFPLSRYRERGEGLRSIVAHPAADHLAPALTSAQIEARAIAAGPLRVLFVGNVIPRKGLHTLLAALAQVRGEWRLSVVGRLDADPKYGRRIMRRIRAMVETGSGASLLNRVSFLGRLSDAELRAQLETHHLLAVPSSYEGFGIVYLEAMAHGLPVIATTAGAAHEIVTPGVDGYLVPPEDPAALAGALQTFLADRERLRAMSLAARARYERHPTWAQNMSRVREFLISLAV